MKEYCHNCDIEITGECIVSEEERNFMNGDVEIDAPVTIYFCSNECEKEYFTPVKKAFIPIEGMQPQLLEGNGYKGIIEYVGKDYFILRSFRDNNPILIKPFQYHNFETYKLKS